jgi:hypothetical protein
MPVQVVTCPMVSWRDSATSWSSADARSRLHCGPAGRRASAETEGHGAHARAICLCAQGLRLLRPVEPRWRLQIIKRHLQAELGRESLQLKWLRSV